MTATPAWNGLPPLAGLCSFEDAQRTAMSVEACVDWIKRHHYLLVRLREIFTARITAEPIYELKTAFSLHAHLCAEHASAFRQRVSELREPPLGLEVVPHPDLKLLCDEVLCSPTTVELIAGVYGVMIPAFVESLKAYIATTNPLADAPTVRLTRFCLLEFEDIAVYGQTAVRCLVDQPSGERITSWLQLLKSCITRAGGISGRTDVLRSVSEGRDDRELRGDLRSATGAGSGDPRSTGEMSADNGTATIEPVFSKTPFQYDAVPKRDARFQDSYNAGVNPEAFLYDERFSARDKVLMMLYKRLREIDVPEMMASIIHQTPGKPWKYYRDMTRQLWDEARHAMLGEVGFNVLGIDWTKIPINFTWSTNLNTQLEPWERHAVLFFIEQGLMPRTGKRYEWEVGQASGIPLAGLYQDFDWADEVLHAQIGREWYVKEFSGLNEAMKYGDQCWSQVLSHWRSYREQGLTEHRNWWPEIYQAACRQWGVTPDPVALAFDTTYESTRADLKEISMTP